MKENGKNNKKSTHIKVYLKPDVKKKFERHAAKLGKSASGILAEIVDAVIEKKKKESS